MATLLNGEGDASFRRQVAPIGGVDRLGIGMAFGNVLEEARKFVGWRVGVDAPVILLQVVEDARGKRGNDFEREVGVGA